MGIMPASGIPGPPTGPAPCRTRMSLAVTSSAGSFTRAAMSSSDVKTTTDKLQKILTDKGVTIFARIDHAAGAKSVGQTLRPMELLVFGNPKLGTSLMQKSPEIGLDLPLKALVFQAENGTTYIAYADPALLAKRYGVADAAGTVTQMTDALKGFAAAAAK